MPPGFRISVVVPTLDESASLPGLLTDLRSLRLGYEAIVVDGGSVDATCNVARGMGARVILAPRGRGLQLRAGADAAAAPLLWFLHADVRLDPAALREIERVAGNEIPGAFALRLRIDSSGLAYRVIEWGANVRSRWARLPYGDQGLLVSRRDYEGAGGYPEIPFMEDVALIRALRRVTSVRLLPAVIRVSARRWEREGILRRTLGNWRLLGAYLLGGSPERLARRYSPSGAAHPLRTGSPPKS